MTTDSPVFGLKTSRRIKIPAPELTSGDIHVWADGSCKGAPGPMGSGVLIRYLVEDGIEEQAHGFFFGEGTNNQAELLAISKAIVCVRQIPGYQTKSVVITTDSQYCIGALTANWRLTKNLEMVSMIKSLLAKVPNVSFRHQRGHKGEYGNEHVDAFALYAREQRMSFSDRRVLTFP